MEPLSIGIDLGTSTSEIAIYRDSEPWLIPDPQSRTKSPIVPSLVAVNNKGELVVGEAAQSWMALPGRGVREIKRLMGMNRTVTLAGKEYRPEEISACILTKLKQMGQTALDREIDEIVLSVPANFNDPQRQATLNAAHLAELKVLRLINEPTAAAMAYGLSHADSDEQIAVFDFGGGTLDITILEMFEGILDVKASFGDTKLGGKDFDDALAALILRKFGTDHPGARISPESRRYLKILAEGAKIDLTSQNEALVRWPGFAVEDGLPVALETVITRDEFYQAAGKIFDRAREVCNRALSIKGVNPKAIDKVLLVGGTTWIPGVRELVKETFGTEPRTDVDPDRAVAMGAAIQAAIIKEVIRPESGLIVTDVSPFGLGLRIAEQVGTQFRDDCYNPLIEPNTTVPFSISRTYSLIHEKQRILKIELYQTQAKGTKYVYQADYTGITGSIADIPPSISGKPHDVVVRFSYNTDGMINLNASIMGTGLEVKLNFSASGLRMSDEDLLSSKARMDELFNFTPQIGISKAGINSLLIKGEMMAKRINDEYEVDRLNELITQLRSVLDEGENGDIENLADELTDFLYDLETKY